MCWGGDEVLPSTGSRVELELELEMWHQGARLLSPGSLSPHTCCGNDGVMLPYFYLHRLSTLP